MINLYTQGNFLVLEGTKVIRFQKQFTTVKLSADANYIVITENTMSVVNIHKEKIAHISSPPYENSSDLLTQVQAML